MATGECTGHRQQSRVAVIVAGPTAARERSVGVEMGIGASVALDPENELSDEAYARNTNCFSN